MMRLFCLIILAPLVIAQGQVPAAKPAQSPAQDPAPKGFASRDPRYRIQPNDVVEVQFRYTPEYNYTGTVQPDGYITMQVVGDFKIGGLTLTDASSAIAKQASAR